MRSKAVRELWSGVCKTMRHASLRRALCIQLHASTGETSAYKGQELCMDGDLNRFNENIPVCHTHPEHAELQTTGHGHLFIMFIGVDGTIRKHL